MIHPFVFIAVVYLWLLLVLGWIESIRHRETQARIERILQALEEELRR